MVAKRWISVGSHDLRIPAPDVRTAQAPAASVVPYFVWSATSATPTEYFVPGFDTSRITTANVLVSTIVAPRNCILQVATLRDVQETLNGPATVTLYLEGVATALSVTIAAGQIMGVNDSTQVAVLRGQRVQLFCDVNNGMALLQCAIGML